jgi:zinc protease
MLSIYRGVASPLLLSLVTTCVAVFLLGMPAARADAPVQPWPQTQSDLAADPSIHYGTLANGMKFTIMHNATPAGQAAIRFRIGAGSLDETDNQRGLAHFLEHMAFKGSTHVGEDEMVHILQRKGLAFGADTNAQTSYDETVFSLDLPETDPDTLSTGLMLMRETASELKLDATAFDRERGVILSEERSRDTPDYQASLGLIRLMLDGQRVPQRTPIGDTEVIRNAPVDLLRDYYRANYRPDRATLIVVGDIDPATIEAEIRARFDDWKPSGPAQPAPDLGTLKPHGEDAHVIVTPGGTTRVRIAWTRPYDASPDTLAKRRAQVVESIGLAVLSRRASVLANKPGAPFIGAAAVSQDIYKSAHMTAVIADSQADQWQQALAAIDQEQRRLVTYGVEQAEVDREIIEARAMLQSTAAGAATRTSTDIADALESSADNDMVFTSPADNLSSFDAITKGLTAAEVDESLHKSFAGSGPRVVLQAAQPPKDMAAAVARAYDVSRTVAVTAPAKMTDVAWPYTNFGTAGTVAERRTVDDLGVTMVRFANGARLTVKPTKLRDNEILVRADVGHGRFDLPRDRPLPSWAEQAVVLSGVNAISYEDLQKALAPNVVGINFSIGDSSFKFEGQTRPEDLAVQMQLLAAYVSDPAYRPEAYKRVQQAYLNMLPRLESTPGSIISRDLNGLLHAGDPRWTFPTRQQLDTANLNDVGALFRPYLSKGPIDVTIVGDVTADEAIRQMAATFGALPAREDMPVDGADAIHFPAPTAQPVTLTHNGRADSAAAVVAIPVGDMLSDLPRTYAANLAGDIFLNRMIDQFRIAEGAAYAPQGNVNLSREIPGYGYDFLYVETTPAKIDRFYALADKIARDLVSGDVSADELARAREPLVETLKHDRQGNEYWLNYLRDVQRDPRRLDRIRNNIDGYMKVSPEDIRAFATAYLKPERFWKLEVLPAAAAVR